MAHTFGDVVLVPFPFTDRSGAKKRPAVIEQSLVVHTLGTLRCRYLYIARSCCAEHWLNGKFGSNSQAHTKEKHKHWRAFRSTFRLRGSPDGVLRGDMKENSLWKINHGLPNAVRGKLRSPWCHAKWWSGRNSNWCGANQIIHQTKK